MKNRHRYIANQCLRVIKSHLRRNICGLSYTAKVNVNVDRLRVSTRISEELRYSRSWWIHHIAEAGDNLDDNGPVHCFLKEHFLHWIEAVHLIVNDIDAVRSLEAMLPLLHVSRWARLFMHLSLTVPYRLPQASAASPTRAFDLSMSQDSGGTKGILPCRESTSLL